MKKLSVKMLTILGMAAIVFASSCKKDDENAPDATITFSANSPQKNNSEVTPGSTIQFELTASDPEKRMKALRIMRGSSPIIPTSASTPAGPLTINQGTGVITAGSNQTFIASISFPAETNLGNYTYTIQILDNTDASKAKVIGSSTVNIRVVPPIRTASSIILGAQNSSYPSFFSATTLRRYDPCVLGIGSGCTANPDSVAVVDIRFAQVGNTKQPQFVSPDSNGGGLEVPSGARTTYFSTTNLNFDNATAADINALNVGTSNKFIQVSNGTTYAFVTKSGKKGLLKVTALDTGTGLNGSVTFDVKVQQ